MRVFLLPVNVELTLKGEGLRANAAVEHAVSRFPVMEERVLTGESQVAIGTTKRRGGGRGDRGGDGGRGQVAARTGPMHLPQMHLPLRRASED